MTQGAAGTISVGTDALEEQPVVAGRYVDAAFLEAARVARVIRARSLLVQPAVAAVEQAALAGTSAEENSLAPVRVRAIAPELDVQTVCLGPAKRNATREPGILVVGLVGVLVVVQAARVRVVTGVIMLRAGVLGLRFVVVVLLSVLL